MKRVKKAVVTISMFVLGRALQSASRVDSSVRHEVARWPEGFCLLMRVLPRGPRLGLVKQGGRLRYLGGRLEDADLVISFKNIEGAFPVFTGLKSSPRAFAERRMWVKGELPRAMAFMRCLTVVQACLFPGIISRRVLKRVPRLGLRGQAVRLFIYLVGIPFGV